MEITRPVCLEVNLKNLQYNINQIKNKVGENVKLMPVIKASGYGTYINQCIDIINQFDIVAVATVDEGVYIRELGYKKEIFVLNQPFESEIEKIIKEYKPINYECSVYYPFKALANEPQEFARINKAIADFINNFSFKDLC